MTFITSINFDEKDPSYKVYKQRFGDNRTFSAWVRQKLLEEADKDEDPRYLNTRIHDLNKQKEEIDYEVSKLKERVKKIDERIETSKLQQIGEKCEDQCNDEAERHALRYFLSYFGIKSNIIREQLAKEFVVFRKENPIEDLQLAIIRFASAKNLQFIKAFPFLKKYEGEVIHVKA